LVVLEFRPLDIVSISIGLIALLFAVISLVVQRCGRRADAKPRLSVKLSWDTTSDALDGTIRLDIWNPGRTPIRLKKVQLLWGRENKETRETISKLGFLPFDAARGVALPSISEDPIHECEGKSFMLPPLPPSMMQRAASQPDGLVWIAIETPDGEMTRLNSDQVLPLLKRYGKVV
jgi:hypothetical protein